MKKNGKIAKALLLAAALLVFSAPVQAEEAAWKKAASAVYKAAVENKMENIAFLSFNLSGIFSGETTYYPADKISQHLWEKKEIKILERARIEEILGEARFSALGGSKGADIIGAIKADAVVTGTIYEDFTRLELSVKLIDAANARVLMSKTLSLEYFPQTFGESGFWKTEDEVPDFDDFRDAPKDFLAGTAQSSPCGESAVKLRKIQENTADLKARYWAEKIRQPGFSYGSLTRNPGSEFLDQEIKSRFYRLLENYWRQRVPAVSAAEKTQVERLLEKEKKFKDYCGGII